MVRGPEEARPRTGDEAGLHHLSSSRRDPDQAAPSSLTLAPPPPPPVALNLHPHTNPRPLQPGSCSKPPDPSSAVISANPVTQV